MIWRMLLLTSLLGLAPSAMAVEPIEQIAEKNCNFGFRLLELLTKGKKLENICISPFSTGLALNVVLDGAAGATEQQLASSMYPKGSVTSESSNVFDLFVANTKYRSEGGYELRTAHSVWLDKSFDYRPEFAEACKLKNVDTQSADFSQKDITVKKINSWAKARTRGQITQIIQSLEEDIPAFFASATYFKSGWESPFDKAETKQMDFQTSEGKKKVAMMHKNSIFMDYGKSDGFQVMQMEFSDCNFEMFIVLPDDNLSLSKLAESMSMDTWRKLKASVEPREGELFLPKFTVNSMCSFKSAFMDMGLKSLFDKDTADFSRMVDLSEVRRRRPDATRVCLSDWRQEDFIRVDEKGCEAVAVDHGSYYVAGGPPPRPPFLMKVDHPFMFILQNRSTDAIIFLGIVGAPD